MGMDGQSLAARASAEDKLRTSEGKLSYLDPVQFQPLPSQVASIARALAAKISS